MTEQELTEKLNQIVKIAQEKILTLLTDLHNEQAIAKANEVFFSYPIDIETIEETQNEFGKVTQVGGYATTDKIIISKKDIQNLDLNDQQSIDNALGTIIHEYAHKFRQRGSKYGEMFEEGSASIFAEMCINYSKVKNNEQSNELFNMLTSVDYQKAESQVRGILYILKQKNIDISMMTEYILGDENRFKQVCTQLFGNSFESYFEQVNKTPIHQQNTSVSEELITQILTDYVKNNQLSYSDYWSRNRNMASSNNLYKNGSSVLVQSVVNAGKSVIKNDELPLYARFKMGNQSYQEKEQFIDDEKRTRIRNKLMQEFNLSGKTKEEINDQLVDLCSLVIQHKSHTDEESKIFLEELNKIVPNIEEFVDKYKQLRVSRLDSTILENMDLSNISFDQIFDRMNSIMSKSQTEKEYDYIATRDPNEVAKIHSNPKYSSWKYEYKDGEYRFYSPNYKKNTEDDLYVTLDDLEPLLSESGYMCLGHGTGRNGNDESIVDSIFDNGLRTKDNSLAFTTIGLSTPTPELIEKYNELGITPPTMDGIKETLDNWDHLDSKKIILARIPTEYINEHGSSSDTMGERYGAFMNEKKQDNGDAVNYLDSKFIIGCYDTEKKKVHLNPKFEKELTNSSIQELKEKYKKTLERFKSSIQSLHNNLFDSIDETKESEQELNEMFLDENGFPIIDDSMIHGKNK